MLRILVAEDDPVSRRVVERAFEAREHTVEAVEDGLEAWKRFQKDPFDVVVSDWNMPGGDGLEFCRRIRAETARPYTYFVMLTGRERASHYVDALQAGADHFLTKPVTSWALDALLITAERTLALHRELERLRRPPPSVGSSSSASRRR